jgi:hypothetical protein
MLLRRLPNGVSTKSDYALRAVIGLATTAAAGVGLRLEPLGPQHNQSDHAAWMSSIEHIRSTPGYPTADGHHMTG